MKPFHSLSAAALAVIAGSTLASAATLTLEPTLRKDLADALPGSPTTPWVSATFTDVVGGVELTLSADNLIGNERVATWYFNIVTPVTGLDFDLQSTVGTVNAPSIDETGPFNDAGFQFDIKFDFSNPPGGAFEDGESLTYFVSATDRTLTIADFMVESSNGGLNFATFVHIIGLDGGLSTKLGTPVPEASTYAAGFALGGLALWSVRRRRTPAA